MLLITNDQANLKLALAEGLQAITMRQFVRSVEAQFPSLVDLLAASAETLPGADDGAGAGAGAGESGQATSAAVAALGATMYDHVLCGDSGGGKGPVVAVVATGVTGDHGGGHCARSFAVVCRGAFAVGRYYAAHLPLSKIQEGLKLGKLRSGTIRLNRDSWSEGTVTVNGADGDFMSVSVSGRENVNRATEVRVYCGPVPVHLPCVARLLQPWLPSQRLPVAAPLVPLGVTSCHVRMDFMLAGRCGGHRAACGTPCRGRLQQQGSKCCAPRQGGGHRAACLAAPVWLPAASRRRVCTVGTLPTYMHSCARVLPCTCLHMHLCTHWACVQRGGGDEYE